MKKKRSGAQPDGIWEDLVDDFLEVYGRISEERRRTVIAKLKTHRVCASEIHRLPCFSIGGRVVVLLKQAENPDVIFCHPEQV